MDQPIHGLGARVRSSLRACDVKYRMDRRGLGEMMRRGPGLHVRMREVAQGQLAKMAARAPRSKPKSGGRPSGELARSGRVEDLGIRPVYKGEPRMTMAVVFYAPYSAIQERRTHFMSSVMKQRFDNLSTDFSEG